MRYKTKLVRTKHPKQEPVLEHEREDSGDPGAKTLNF